MRVAAHDAKVERHRQSHAATNAKPFDGADGDLLHLLPRAGQPRSELQVPAQRTDVHGFARAAFGIFQSKLGAERLGPAGERHDGGVAVVLEAARGLGELTRRLRRQRVDAVAAVKAHHSDPPLRPEALFDGYKFRQVSPRVARIAIFFSSSSMVALRKWHAPRGQ